jgi:hypothetical protein
MPFYSYLHDRFLYEKDVRPMLIICDPNLSGVSMWFIGYQNAQYLYKYKDSHRNT